MMKEISEDNQPTKNYFGVQALRGLGAILVIVFHTTVMVRDKINPESWMFVVGAAGIDLFFCISGFIIVIASQKTWGKPGAALPFIKRRLIRIVPLYWMVTTIKLAILLVGGTVAIHGWHTIASYLFIPAWNSDHKVFPLLVPGWTLAYEMFFYLMFALMLLLKKSPLVPLSVMFSAFAIIGAVFPAPEFAVLTLLNQRLLEFVMGMWIAKLAISERLMPARLAIVLMLFSLVIIFCTNGLPSTLLDAYPLLLWGLPSAVLLYAVVSLEKVRLWRNPVLRYVGDASYAIYLTHEFAVSAVRVFIQKLHMTGSIALATAIALSILVACTGGLIIHVFIEKPVTRRLRTLFVARR